MKTLTVATKLTEKMIEIVDALVDEGIYANRSEALRDAVRLQIRMYWGILKEQKPNTETGTLNLTKKDKDRILKNFFKKKGWEL